MRYLTMAAVAAAVLAWSQLASAREWEHCATEGGFCRAPAGAVIHGSARQASAAQHEMRSGLARAWIFKRQVLRCRLHAQRT